MMRKISKHKTHILKWDAKILFQVK